LESLLKWVAVISVLYIDSDPVLLDSGKRFLERETGIRVDIAHTTTEALERLKNGSFDAIISDHMLPDIDSIHLLHSVREKFPKLPFIIFSGQDREEIFIETLTHGADDYIRKGGDPKSQLGELSHKLKRAIEFRESELKIARLNRIDAILRRINESVVHIHDRMLLMQEVCKIMVKEAGFVMAWVGFEDPDTHRINRVTASGIVDDFFVKVRLSSDDIANGPGPAATAIRKGKYSIWNDIQAYPAMEMWEEDALRKGYRSAAAFPLSTGKTIHGAITLYSYEKNFFTDSEIRLLNGISEDISFVLKTMEIEDIQRRVREELETSEHRLIEIINFLPDATFAIDTQGTVIVWNKAMEKLTQVSAEKVIGLGNYEYSIHILGSRMPGLLDLVFATDTELEKYHYSAIQRSHNCIKAQIQVPRLKGKPATLELMASLLFDQNGQLSGAIQSMYDVRELRQKDEKFHRLFDTTDHGIIILESDSRKIIDANSFIVTLMGYPLEYLLGRNLGEIGFSAEAIPPEQFFTELEKTGYVQYKDIPLVTKSGRIINVEFISRVNSLNDHQIIQCLIYDISDRKRAESARIHARKNLDMFSSMIRHDILNQLMVVSGSLELASYGIQEPDLLKHLARAQTATKTIQRQIIFTREYENLGADTPTWQQVSTVIRRAFLEVETESIILNIEQDSPDVFADPLFEKVFYHLFNYSYKYGEKVTRIEVSFHKTMTELIIAVADNGIGISPENKVHLFEWRSGNEKTLGLFLAQKILASTGITIRETGEYKKGIRFEIIVPMDGFQPGSRQLS
jgi:PAS domain S-box-containing protein